jgi:predicted homoserine dehydrogenase-like protein
MSSRRSFLIGAGLTAAASRSVVGAGDRIRLGFIGAGTRGSYMATVAEDLDDCHIDAMCDVYKPTLESAAAKLKTKPVETYGDYRRIPRPNS